MEIIFLALENDNSKEAKLCQKLSDYISLQGHTISKVHYLDEEITKEDRYDNIVVIPEKYSPCHSYFKRAKVILWWMDNDNHFIIESSPAVQNVFSLHLVSSDLDKQYVLEHFPDEPYMFLSADDDTKFTQTADAFLQYINEQTEDKRPINVLIYGANDFSSFLSTLVQLYNAAIRSSWGEMLRVVGFIDDSGNTPILEGIPVLSLLQAKAMVLNELVDALLVPRENFWGQSDYLGQFMTLNIDLQNVYIANWLNQDKWSKDDLMNLFTPYYSCGYLPYLEFHLADHCNLNCAYCEHYSGLVEEPVFTDFEQFKKDLVKLSEFIPDIGMIRLLGGEPLLNKEISDYLLFTRKVYPNAQIWVTTNGILLKSMPDDFYETMKKTDAKIWISSYPPLKDKIPEIYQYVTQKGVECLASIMADKFRKCQVLEPNDDKKTIARFASCYQKGCRNLYNGHIAACFLPFTTKYFNNYFDVDLPEDGAIDLYEEGLTLEDIMQRLSTPFERCRYCDTPVDADWRQIEMPSTINDWIK